MTQLKILICHLTSEPHYGRLYQH